MDKWFNCFQSQTSVASAGPSDLLRVRLHGSLRVKLIYAMTFMSISRRVSCNERNFSTYGGISWKFKLTIGSESPECTALCRRFISFVTTSRNWDGIESAFQPVLTIESYPFFRFWAENWLQSRQNSHCNQLQPSCHPGCDQNHDEKLFGCPCL